MTMRRAHRPHRLTHSMCPRRTYTGTVTPPPLKGSPLRQLATSNGSSTLDGAFNEGTVDSAALTSGGREISRSGSLAKAAFAGSALLLGYTFAGYPAIVALL